MTSVATGQRVTVCPTRPMKRAGSEKLGSLREIMSTATAGRPIEAYIVTSDDEHQNEYVADRDKRLEYISGFTGRKGYAAITKNNAALWVNNDEFWIADADLECDWQIYRIGDDNVTLTTWLRKELRTGVRVGADPKLIPAAKWEEWRRDLEWNHIALSETATNLVDDIWTVAVGRPQKGINKAFAIPDEVAGEPISSKLEWLRSNMTRVEADAVVVTAMDEIAWLLNIRGHHALYNPFIESYLLVTRNEVFWFVSSEDSPDINVMKAINRNALVARIILRAYDDIWKELKSPNYRRIIVPGACEFSPGASQAILSTLPLSKRVVRPSPVIYLRANKNSAEIRGMRLAGVKESVAFIEFMMFLENEVQPDVSNWTEGELGRKLQQLKQNQTEYQGQATPLRIAYGKHGAFSKFFGDNESEIGSESTIVIHSVSHYLGGSASIARTLHLGQPSRTEIETYTLMLAALIQISRQVFPSDLKALDLDTIVKSRLWGHGLAYQHGTGHGIGVFSNYFESPLNINRNSKWFTHTLQRGSFITAGPSYSQPGGFGIHIENVLQAVPTVPQYSDGSKQYLSFNAATLVPFEEKLIQLSLLSMEEVAYINYYHERVLQEVGAELKRQAKMDALYWLMKKTKALTPHCSSSSPATPIFFAGFPLILHICLKFL